MILGLYYMTREMVNQKGEGMIFANTNEALAAYDSKLVTLHAKIKLRVCLLYTSDAADE